MRKLANEIKKIEQLEIETVEVSRITYLKILRELVRLRYKISKSKKKT